MDCGQLRERIAPLLDGVLSPEEERGAAEHLERCEACAALVERSAAIPLGPPLPPVAQPPGFWVAMDRALAAEAERPPTAWRRLNAWLSGEVQISRATIALYAALLGAAFAWHLLAPPRTLREPPPAAETPDQAAREPMGAGTPEPAPAAAPAPPRQRLEKASYQPIQQVY